VKQVSMAGKLGRIIQQVNVPAAGSTAQLQWCSTHTGTISDNNNNRLTAFGLGLPGYAGTRRNTHPLTPILIIGQPLTPFSIYNDP